MNRLLLSCLASLALYGTISSGQYQSDGGNSHGAQNSGGAPASGGHIQTGGQGNGSTNNMVTENAPSIKLFLEAEDRIKLVMEGGGMVQIQEVVLEHNAHKWAVKICKRGTADIGEGSQRELLVRDGGNGTKRWVECGMDSQLRRSMEPGEVQNQLKTVLKDLHISGGGVRDEGWTEEDRGEHAVKEVELKQTGGGRWIMEVVTSSKRDKRKYYEWDDDDIPEMPEEERVSSHKVASAPASGDRHETGGHGNGGTTMVAENATRIKLVLEGRYRIKLVMERGGMVQIQEIVLKGSRVGHDWAVKSCKRGSDDTVKRSQRGILVRDGDNGTKRWVECGMDGQLKRSMKPGEVQNQLKTLLKDLHISGGDVRGEGWTEEDRGEHGVKEVELKQTGGGRWIMEVVTGSKREKKHWRRPKKIHPINSWIWGRGG